MDAAQSPSKSSRKAHSKSLFSKAKSLVRISNKALDESDTTGDSESLWKSESELGSDPAQQSPTTPSSRSSKQHRLKHRSKHGHKASLAPPKSASPKSPGSLAGQKIRRSNIDILEGPPLANHNGEMNSVNNETEVAIVSPTKKKSKRRKSLGAISDTKEKTRTARETGRKSTKRSNSQPRISAKGLTGKSASTRNTGAGLEDLMAHIGSPTPPAEMEGTLKDDIIISPSGKARTTVDRDGKIRRVNSKKQLEDCESDDDAQSKRSGRSKMSAKSGVSRKKKKPKKPVDGDGSAGSERPKVKKKHSKDMDLSAHSEKSETKKTKKKMSKRDVMEWGNSSDSSLRSDRSEKKMKKKTSKRDLLDTSNHSKKRENSKRDLMDDSDNSIKSDKGKRASTERRGGRREGLSPLASPDSKKPSKSKSVPNLIDHAALPFGDDLKASESLTPPTSDISLGKVGMVIGASPGAGGDMDKDQQQLLSRIEQLSLEKDAAHVEVSKLRRELRDVKLESQRSHTERRELRADLREREFVIKESDMRIEALEKAVESQLDKMDDMEEELRRANEEVFILEEKLSHMESVLTDSSAIEAGGAKKEAEMAQNRQQRLERRLEEKEKNLVERENALKEERRLFLKDGQSNRSVDQLEQDNRMLLKAMNREKAENHEKLSERDAEIAALRTELQRTENGDTSGGGGGGSIALLRKKDDQISLLERELAKLKKDLEDRDLGDFDRINRELQAAKNEGQAMKSKYEGAQRRNLILEDEIDHWKSVNCNLEDELAEQKAQANSWRVKYEDVVEPTDGDDGGGFDHRPIQSGMSAAEMAMSRNGYESEEDDRTVNTISGLWSKLTTPQSKKPTLGGGTLPSGSLKDVIARSTFH